MEYKVDKKTAEAEFSKWAESFHIDCEVDEMDSEELTDFNKIKKQFVLAIRQGRLTVDEENNISLKLIEAIGDKESIEFPHKFNSSAFVAMDRHKDKEGVKKTFSFLGRWTNTDATQLHKMESVDMKLCISIVTLFFA